MRCPLCAVPTEVKETRVRDDNSIFRRRVCFNEHVFQTVETAVSRPIQRRKNAASQVSKTKESQS
jgi:transcriptional regulator NrdR family protein